MPVALNSVLQVVIFLVILLLLTKPMGLYLTRVFAGERTWLTPVFAPVERLFYQASGINPEEEQKWRCCVFAMLIFSVVGRVVLYLILHTQGVPLFPVFNPQEMPPGPR